MICSQKLKKSNNKILSDCLSVDSELDDEYDPSNIYPDFVITELEKFYMITNKFFGYGSYKNTKNGQEMRDSLKNNEKNIIPSLEVVNDKHSFYQNSHVKVQR